LAPTATAERIFLRVLAADRVIAFVRLGRPLFLAGGFILYGLGAAIAAFLGYAIDGVVYGHGQIAITATQLMTHYCNDYFDLEADRANTTPTRWSGGSRVLPGGELPPWTALAAAVVLGAIALAAAVTLTARAECGPLTLPLVAVAGVLSWEYSAPPLRLHSRGLGELTVAIVVSGLVPIISFYLQAGRIEALPVLAIVPLCCFQLGMLLAIEFPDAAGDAAVGKRTLVVRLGPRAAAWLHVGVLLCGYAMLPLLAAAGLPAEAAAAVGVTSPLALWLWHAHARRRAWCRAERWEGLAFVSVALLVSAAAAELAAFVLLARRGG